MKKQNKTISDTQSWILLGVTFALGMGVGHLLALSVIFNSLPNV